MSTTEKRGRRRIKNLVKVVRGPKPEVGVTPADVMHTENKWRLLRYRARPEGFAYETPVLMVPSLINRHYVLDLMPGKSLAEWLVARGHDVWIIDWGRPGPEDRHLTLDTITDDYIGRAVRKAARSSPRGKAHVLGYCLGGTLATAYAAARPDHVASLLALAAPVSFEDEGLLATWVRSRTFDIDALVGAFGNVPWPLMQAAFQLLRPTLGLAKAVYMLDRAWDDAFLDGFLALETWGNDNVSFPGEAYRRYIQELYRDNRLLEGTFRLHGRPARLESITCPVRAYTFQHDNIVPWKSAAALVDRVSSVDKERIDLPGGHVGAVVSRKASQTLWPHMAQWWAERDAEPKPASARRRPKKTAA